MEVLHILKDFEYSELDTESMHIILIIPMGSKYSIK